MSVSAGARAPLSYNQEFLGVFDRGEAQGAFGNRHTLVHGWRVNVELDVDALRGALDDVVVRHEALRTSVEHGAGPGAQVVHPPTGVDLRVRDLPAGDAAARELCAEELINEVDAEAFGVAELPHLRAVLGRFDRSDAVLVLATHHTASDPWSMQVIMRDLGVYYAARTGHGPAQLPPAPQYRDFAVWQHEVAGTPEMAASRGYWREKLRDAEVLAIPTDRPRPAEVPNSFAVHRFLLDTELTSATLRFARSARSSPFIVLFAAYNLLLHQRTGVLDLAVTTFTAGRGQERFHDTVGMFVNFVPLRTDLRGAHTVGDAVGRTRKSCLEAYQHDIPFPLIMEEAPGLARQFGLDDHTVVTFELLQSGATPDTPPAGALVPVEIRRRRLSQRFSSHIPDGGLWAMDVLPSGELAGSLKYNSNLFDGDSIVELAAEFRDVLHTVVSTPDLAIRQLRARGRSAA